MGYHFVPPRYLKAHQTPEKPEWIWLFHKGGQTPPSAALVVAAREEPRSAEDFGSPPQGTHPPGCIRG